MGRFLKRKSLRSFVSIVLLMSASLSNQFIFNLSSAKGYSSSSSGIETTLTFAYTNTVETFTVPSNVTEVTITVTGGEGLIMEFAQQSKVTKA
jgi:hypothetical protein